MAREFTIPSPSTYIEDYGLNVTPPPALRNKRVVILGTAEDGPMYEPIQIEKPEDAEFVWGRSSQGDLVRGIFECWDVQAGYPTVVGVRIGDGKKAKLEIEESSGSGQDAAQTTTTNSLKLEAIQPGQIFNQVTIGYDSNRNVAIYNPKTGQTSTFSVDTVHPTNSTVDAHNVAELVDAINADPNLNSVITASYSGLQADYEIAVSGTSNGVSATSTKVVINLKSMGPYITQSGFMVSAPVGTGLTGTNDIIEFDAIEAVSISDWEEIPCKGKTTAPLSLTPLDGKSPATWQTIQAMYDYNSDGEYIHDPSGNVVSEFIYSFKNELAVLTDTGTTSGGYVISGTPSNTIRFEIPLCPDDSESGTTGYASGYAASLVAGSLISQYANWSELTSSGIKTNSDSIKPSGVITIQVADSSNPNDFWQTLPYDSNSGIYMTNYVPPTATGNGYAIFSIGASANVSGVNFGKMQCLVDEAGRIREGKFVRLSGYSIKGQLTEVENLNAVFPTSAPAFPVVDKYFIRGPEVVFNTPPPYNIICNYGTRIKYEVGSTVDITDPYGGEVTFQTTNLLPGPGGATLSNTVKSYLRFRYKYMPTWPNITSAAKALTGGTNGNILTGLKRKNELQKAYDNLRNYRADIWVPMDAFIDTVAERYNPTTGLKEEIVVGYQDQLADFLEDLSINSRQPHAILGVEPISGTPTQAAKDLWVKRLTVQDISDPNRAANVMALIENKFISVTAMEPVFLNIGRGRPYVANGQAAYAGMIASMPYDISPTNKPIKGIQNVRFELAIAQYEAINNARYVMMKPRTGQQPVIIEDKTAAPPGSDFVNWSVYSITAEASNRVFAIAETFIGKPNSIEIRASLEQLISNGLNNMDGLRAFDFSISSSPNQQVLGIIEIDLVLVPIFTIKKIRTTVKLRKNLAAA